MKDIIKELRARFTDPLYLETEVDDCKIGVIVEAGIVYIAMSNNYLTDLAADKNPHLFVALKLIEEQARRKELEALLNKQLIAGEPNKIGEAVPSMDTGAM